MKNRLTGLVFASLLLMNWVPSAYLFGKAPAAVESKKTGNSEAKDAENSEGVLWIVMIVVLIIWAGLAGLLVRIDMKTRKIEKRLDGR